MSPGAATHSRTDPTHSQGNVIIASTVSTWIAALIFVLLRIGSRMIRAVALWADDWLIIAALIPSCGHVISISGYNVSHGLGKHVWQAPADAVYAWALALFTAEICYTLTLALAKLSILFFYWRVFSVYSTVRVFIWVLGCIVCIWAIAVLLVTFLQCMPIHALWDRFRVDRPTPEASYECPVNARKFFYGNAIPTIVTDGMMLALPVPYIWRLQLGLGQKLGVLATFGLGIIVTIISILRFTFLLKLDLNDKDITWSFTPVAVLSIIEGNIAIICACLPSLGPITKKWFSILQKLLLGTVSTHLSSASQGEPPNSWIEIESREGQRHTS